jgi:phosphate-selective porin OprO/OprP
MQNNFRMILAVSFLSLRLLNTAAWAQTQDDLVHRIDDLEQQLRTLKSQLQSDKESAENRAKMAPVLTAGADGFNFRSGDSNFVLRLDAHIQADGRFYPGNGSGTAQDTFLMRRVRPIIEGTVFEKFDYRLMLDFGSGLTSSAGNIDFVQEAFVNARVWPEFQVQAGKFKGPVGLERLKADKDTVFIERSYPTLLVPNREVGAQLQGRIGEGLLEYQAGVFNGVADSGSEDVETADGDKDF